MQFHVYYASKESKNKCPEANFVKPFVFILEEVVFMAQ